MYQFIKKHNNWQYWSILLIIIVAIIGAIIAGKQYHDKNYLYSGDKQATIVQNMRDMRNANYTPQDITRYYNKHSHHLNNFAKGQATLQIYRAVQNRDLYYNARASFLQGELNYSRTLHPQASTQPLSHLELLDNNIITGFIKETQNQFLKAWYMGDDMIFLLPNYVKLNHQFNKDLNNNTRNYFTLGIKLQKNAPINGNQVDLNNALMNFNAESGWLDVHKKDNHYHKDVLALMKINYDIIFGLNNSLVYDNFSKRQYRSDYIEELKNAQPHNKFLANEIQYFLKHLRKNRTLSNQDQELLVAKSEKLFANDVFNSSRINLTPMGALNDDAKKK